MRFVNLIRYHNGVAGLSLLLLLILGREGRFFSQTTLCVCARARAHVCVCVCGGGETERNVQG